ncbi:hypothetical protein AaE_015505 [Aphanomyces astaci]|uniref:Uncharacterized protein n=1 Tax=Aphanomyces astaci TaxID=112090 RepID=A0A6A4YVT2_APHAT|nr:hypothetical protein AaE_015505 [Aphanomyces astaci]
MPKVIFRALAHELSTHGGLSNTRHLDVTEQLGIFLFFAGQHASSAQLQQRFQHSGETIHRHIRRVVSSIAGMAPTFIQIPSDDSKVPREIYGNPKFFPFFEHCRMAVDGTHVPVSVPEAIVAPFQGRKGVTMNVLAACDFDLMFTYVLAGWEGSAGDGKTVYDIMDAGFALTTKCLTPYRSTRYHLKEFGRGRQGPQTKEELFNLRHAMLRNVIERIFGILKRRFPVLGTPVQYDYGFQVELVMALCVVHNFIRVHGCRNDIYVTQAIQDLRIRREEPLNESDRPQHHPEMESTEAKEWRDGIAVKMWTQYQETMSRRNQRRSIMRETVLV